LDFGLVRTFCIGNRSSFDDGSGGGTADNGIQEGSDQASHVPMRVFALTRTANRLAPAGDPGQPDRRLTTPTLYPLLPPRAGDYVVVADVVLSTNLTGFAFRNGFTGWNRTPPRPPGWAGIQHGYNRIWPGRRRRDHGRDTRSAWARLVR
jgi:hypothetical protein